MEWRNNALRVKAESRKEVENMLENWLSWVWVVMAVLLAIAEIFTAGFFLIGFAIGAAAAAVAAFMGFAPLAQFAVFVVASALSLLLARPLVNRVSDPNTNPVG